MYCSHRREFHHVSLFWEKNITPPYSRLISNESPRAGVEFQHYLNHLIYCISKRSFLLTALLTDACECKKKKKTTFMVCLKGEVVDSGERLLIFEPNSQTYTHHLRRSAPKFSDAHFQGNNSNKNGFISSPPRPVIGWNMHSCYWKAGIVLCGWVPASFSAHTKKGRLADSAEIFAKNLTKNVLD